MLKKKVFKRVDANEREQIHPFRAKIGRQVHYSGCRSRCVCGGTLYVADERNERREWTRNGGRGGGMEATTRSVANALAKPIARSRSLG